MNTIRLSGIVTNSPELSHEVKGEKFYKFYISSARDSGISDTIPCIASEIFMAKIAAGIEVTVDGEIRTRNAYDNNTSQTHLQLFVFVTEILPYIKDVNEVELQGYICRKPIYRTTPRGRQIAETIIAVNRSYAKTSYIPTIVWGRNAVKAADMESGMQVKIIGRLQSREYNKVIEGQEITKTTYELSASCMYVVSDDEEVEEYAR